MRTITPEMLEAQRNADDPIGYILNTPKPDFTELNKICAEFEEEMKKVQEEDRKKTR